METFALCRVAGSSTVHSWCVPGTSRLFARSRDRFCVTTGASGRSRVSVRVAPPDVIARFRCHVAVGEGPSTVPFTTIGPVPGSSENSKLRRVKLRIDACRRADPRGRVLAEEQHLQPAVFLQLESVIGSRGLADGEADLLAAVVHAAPHGRGAVARQVSREVGVMTTGRTIVATSVAIVATQATRTRNANGRVMARGNGLKSVIDTDIWSEYR